MIETILKKILKKIPFPQIFPVSNYERYKIGNIAILDLNDASHEKDRAKKNYIQSLHNFWRSYYELRMKTLYDFESDKVIGDE